MNPLVAPEAHARAHRTALSVNVNKIALLRNTRHLVIPDVVKLSQIALQAGAQGITVHPRPDARHIRLTDVHDLATLMQQWPQADYNIEGNPFQNLMDCVRALCAAGQRPQQVTFVPDSEDQFTSDHGWRFPDDLARLQPLIDEVRALGIRVSLFMDPLPEMMAAARASVARRRRMSQMSVPMPWIIGGLSVLRTQTPGQRRTRRTRRTRQRPPGCSAGSRARSR